MAFIVSKRPVLQVWMWSVFAAGVHASYAFFLVIDANGSFDEAFQEGTWQSSIFAILIAAILVFVAGMSLGILWLKQLLPRSIFIGALIGCATIGAGLGSWASYSAVENNPQDTFWDTATGRLHLLGIFSVFYPWFLFAFVDSVFLVFSVLTPNYWIETKRRNHGSRIYKGR